MQTIQTTPTTKPIVRATGPKQPSLTTRNRERLQSAAKYCDTPAGPLSIEVPASLYRLAKQLGRDPEGLAAEVMLAGIEALDDGIARTPTEDFNPVCFVSHMVGYAHCRDFTITSWIERMRPEVLADCELEAAECNQKLQEIVRERILRGADLRLLAGPVIGGAR